MKIRQNCQENNQYHEENLFALKPLEALWTGAVGDSQSLDTLGQPTRQIPSNSGGSNDA